MTLVIYDDCHKVREDVGFDREGEVRCHGEEGFESLGDRWDSGVASGGGFKRGLRPTSGMWRDVVEISLLPWRVDESPHRQDIFCSRNRRLKSFYQIKILEYNFHDLLTLFALTSDLFVKLLWLVLYAFISHGDMFGKSMASSFACLNGQGCGRSELRDIGIRFIATNTFSDLFSGFFSCTFHTVLEISTVISRNTWLEFYSVTVS